jgi:hypothetical protein
MRASWVKFQSEQEGNCGELGSRRIAKNGFQISSPLFSHCHSWFAASPARRGAGAGFDARDDIVVKPIA